MSVVDDGSVALFDRLGLPVCVVGRDRLVTYWNDGMVKLFGHAADEAIGRDPLALGVAATETSAAADAFERVAAGEAWQGRLPVVRRDGSRLIPWWLIVPLADGAGGALVALDTEDAGDDAEAKNAEEANLLLDAVLNNAPIAVAIFDRGLRYVRINEALAHINGMPAEDHIGVGLHQLFPELDAGPARDIRQVFETGKPVIDAEVVMEVPSDPGVDRHFVVSYFPISLRGEIGWVGAVILDETERHRLLAAEQAARREAERTADQLARLQAITALLSGTRTRDDVCNILVNQGVAGVDATTSVLCLLTDSGDEVEIVRSVGLMPEAEQAWSRFPLAAPVPACDAMRTGKPVLFANLEERDRLYPIFSGQPSRNQAYATVPLTVDRKAIGAVTFGWTEPRQFTDDDSRFLTALAEQCAQALDRCRLAEAEARERRRKEFLAEASALLASSLDYEATIEQVARLLVPELGDACAVHLSTPQGLQLVTIAHVDAEHQKLLERIGARDQGLARRMGLHDVARTRRPLLVESADFASWEALAKDDEQRVHLQRLGIRSGIAVPLIASGESLGVLSISTSVSGRHLRHEDIAVAQDVADRAAVAIYNARAHRALRDVARTLQRSLLPADRPVIPGLDVAAVYHPVSDSEVGGDFYDVFPVAPGKWGVVMGDVCGKGVQAASLTALARYTVRTAAVGADAPSDVLRRLNQAVLDEGADDRFCTIAHLVVEPVDGQANVTLSCGGHPLPLHIDAAGELRSIGRPGSGIGMFPEPDLVDTVHVLKPGESLVLFTDGVLEARSPDGAFDPELFTNTLRAAARDGAVDAHSLAAAAEAAVLAFEGGRARDDMAILVLRVPEVSA